MVMEEDEEAAVEAGKRRQIHVMYRSNRDVQLFLRITRTSTRIEVQLQIPVFTKSYCGSKAWCSLIV